MEKYDVLVIGGGPGGYVAALRAAQLGFKTACVDAFTRNGKMSLGGTCLNVGCIPSKALLDSSERYEQLLHDYDQHGITVSDVKLDVSKMLARKEAVVDKLTGGIQYLFKKNKITGIHGFGKLVRREGDAWVVDAAGTEVAATHVIVATGSAPRELPLAPFDGETIVDNVGALSFPAVPQRLGVIGAGVIGLELGSVWLRLGAQVTVLEALPAFLAAVDETVAKEAAREFKKQGLDIRLGVTISKVEKTADGVTLTYTENGAEQTLALDKLIVSIGRVPYTQHLGAEAVGLTLTDRGFVQVDAHYKTNLPNMYAVGDVIGGAMLAHKAEDEGMAVAELIAGQAGHVNYDAIPWVIYTSPEIAWVGRTEQDLRAAGVPYKTGRFNFSANGRALGHGDPRGFVKVIAHAETDELLGVHMFGAGTSELLAEAVALMEFRASAEDLARTTHGHPTLSEVVKEAALAAIGRPLHS